ncbi:Ig-like domain repeat protein [Methanobrevibacter sp.]
MTYWSANGIANTGSSPTTPARSKYEAGQNITLSVVVNDKLVLSEVITTDENGMIVLPIIAGDNYYVTARHDADSYYTEAKTTISNNTKFNVNVTSQTTHNKTVNITAKSNIFNEFMEGKLLFLVPNSDSIIANYAGNGTWWTVHTFDDYGNYQVNATYVGLDNVTINNATISISKTPTNITVENTTVDLFVGGSVATGATLTPADAGNLTFTSSNSTVAKVENGKIVALSEGTAIITISFAGNDKYAAAENKTISVTVSLNDASVSVNNSTLNLLVDDTFTIVPTTKPDGLTVTFIPDDSGVYSVDENGIVTALKEGTGSVLVKVGGDGIYAENSTTVAVTVSKVPTEINLVNSTVDMKVGDEVKVNATLTPSEAGELDYTSSDVSVITINGIGELTAVGEGTANITVRFLGDDKYVASNATVTVTVNKQDTTPDITIPSDITFGDDSSIEVKLPSDAEGNVTLKVDGKVVDTVPVTNGTASVKLPELSAGNHSAEITYSGDDKYKTSSKNTTFTVNKASTKISAAGVTATYKVDKYLVIKLTDSKGNPMVNAKISVNLNGAKDYTTDKNGQVKIKVSTMVPKTYTAKITFAGNENYTGSSDSAKVVVKKATPKITATNKMFKTTTKTKKYTITLKDNTGKAIRNAKVTLKVNGKTYKATTNSKGMATFKITKLNKKGTFKATVTYKGSKYYNKASKKVSIKVISAWKTVQKGSKLKSTVKEIQRALKNNGYYLTAYGHYLKVDGIYWDYTVKAVKQFQKAKGLKVTGKVDEKTAKKLGII